MLRIHVQYWFIDSFIFTDIQYPDIAQFQSSVTLAASHQWNHCFDDVIKRSREK